MLRPAARGQGTLNPATFRFIPLVSKEMRCTYKNEALKSSILCLISRNWALHSESNDDEYAGWVFNVATLAPATEVEEMVASLSVAEQMT